MIVRLRCAQGKGMTYYVSWVGYDSDQNTWEPAANFQCVSLRISPSPPSLTLCHRVRT